MLLPVGSVVYLAEGNQKVVILNRGPIVNQNGEDVFFDYTGALYPEGLDPEQVYYFNDEDIDEVVFEGYKDDDEKRFAELYKQWQEKEGSQMKKGKTSSR